MRGIVLRRLRDLRGGVITHLSASITAEKSGHCPPASMTVLRSASAAGPMRTPILASSARSTARRRSFRASTGENQPGWPRSSKLSNRESARGTHNRALGQNASQQVVGNGMPPGRGNGLGEGGDTRDQQHVGDDLHRCSGAHRSAVGIPGTQISPQGIDGRDCRERAPDQKAAQTGGDHRWRSHHGGIEDSSIWSRLCQPSSGVRRDSADVGEHRCRA